VLIDLERLLRMGVVDIVASSEAEKAPPQSGLGGSTTTAGPLPGKGVTSPADLPPLMVLVKKLLHWQPVGDEVVVELVVLMVGVDEKVEQQQLVEEALRPGRQDEPSSAS